MRFITFLLLITLSFFTSNSFAAPPKQPLPKAYNECVANIKETEVTQKNGFYYFQKATCLRPYVNNQDTFNSLTALLKISVDKKFLPANYWLALLYLNKYEKGSLFYNVQGKPTDLLLAIGYLKLLIQNGSALAKNLLGEIYLDSANLSSQYNALKDIPDSQAPVQLPDMQKAIIFLTEAAESGNPAAQGTLSDLYRQGIGVSQNYIFAYVWQSVACTSQSLYNPIILQDDIGKKLLKSYQNTRDELYNKLTEEQKNQAELLTKEYSTKYIQRPDNLDEYCFEIQKFESATNSAKLLKVLLPLVSESSKT